MRVEALIETRDSLCASENAPVLRGLLTYYFWRLKCEINLTVLLIGNFQNESNEG